jgi:hypothetical protein
MRTLRLLRPCRISASSRLLCRYAGHAFDHACLPVFIELDILLFHQFCRFQSRLSQFPLFAVFGSAPKRPQLATPALPVPMPLLVAQPDPNHGRGWLSGLGRKRSLPLRALPTSATVSPRWLATIRSAFLRACRRWVVGILDSAYSPQRTAIPRQRGICS